MLKRFSVSVGIFFDYVKDILIFILLSILVIVFLSIIIHNVLKIIELVDDNENEYKNIVQTESSDCINVYCIGEGRQTIVILPGFGIQSPIVFYKNLAESLKENYKIVIIEYPGYGFAKNTTRERTNENLSLDIKQALEKSEIYGPYILMAHSISNVYAMKFIQNYPELVQGVISLDGEYPEIINTQEGKNIVKNTVKNVKITSILEYTGFARILSYIKPDIYYIDLLSEDKNISKSDIELYRKMIATNYLTKSMVNEIQNLEDNLEELKNYKYPDNLPVLQILSTDTIEQYDELYGKGKLKNFAENTITNSKIQKVVSVNGKHMINLSSLNDILLEINSFLN